MEGGRPCFEDPSRISVITPNVEALWRGGIDGGGPLEGVVFFLVLSHCSTCKKRDFIKALERLLKGDAMNLTLIYNDVTPFPSWILLSWYPVQDRYLSCSRTIIGSTFPP